MTSTILNSFSNSMNYIVTEEENLQQLDQLWDMYYNGVNSELFKKLITQSNESLKQYPDENIFHKVMADFILDYRKFHNC